MADDRVLPADLQAEEALIGAALLNRQAIADTRWMVAPEDFFKPTHQALWSVILDLWNHGAPIDSLTVIDGYRKIGGTSLSPETLMDLAASCPAISNGKRYAEMIARKAAARRMVSLAVELGERVYAGDDPSEVLDFARDRVSTEGARSYGSVDDVVTMDTFNRRYEDAMRAAAQDGSDWLIPGLLRRKWRIVIVAPEGIGKSVLLRQLAIFAANGIHPLSLEVLPPRTHGWPRVLYIDLENPDEVIYAQTESILARCRPSATYEADKTLIWHREAGIDLRTAVGRSELESRLVAYRPDIVCLGPLYKTHRASHDYEAAAADVQATLDDLRSRYDFGLIMEHHAAKGSGGVRALDPAGSAFWLRWSEIGIRMAPAGPDGTGAPSEEEATSFRFSTVRLGRFRGDRVRNGWPRVIRRSDPEDLSCPWVGDWGRGPGNDGAVAEQAAETPIPPPDAPPAGFDF